MFRSILSLSLLALATACAPADGPDAAETAPVLSYTDAFIMAPIGDRDMSMGGVSLSVEGGDVRLIGASSSAIGTIELHTMQMNDGKMQMRQVEGFDLAEGETLTLKRGGNHFMLFDLDESVATSETVDITLDFESTEGPLNLVVEADVKAVGED